LPEAEALASQAVGILTRDLPAGDWRTAMAKGVLGDCLVALGRLDEARPLLQEALTGARATQDPGGDAIRRAAERQARYEAALHRLASAPIQSAASLN